MKRLEKLLRKDYAIWIIIVIGVCARIAQYMHNRSLWLDEAMLALNIVEKDYSELLLPLDYMQAAPVGFLLVTNVLVEWLGSNEKILRLLPLTVGIASVPLFYILSRKLLHGGTVYIAVLLFSLSPYTIYYSSEFKQYSLDVFVVIIIVLFAFRLYQNGFNLKDGVVLAGIGAVAVWFSHAVIFVMTGAGITLFIIYTQKEYSFKKKEFLVLSFIGICWIISFLVNYFLFTKPAAHDGFFWYWADRFAPFPPTHIDDVFWYASALLGILNSPFGFSFTPIIFLISLAGVLVWWKAKNIFPLLLLLLSSSILYGLSAADLYPIASQLVLFLLPLGYLVIAEGLYFFYRSLKTQNYIIAVLFILIVLYPPLRDGSQYLWNQQERQETRPLVDYYVKNNLDDEILYVYYGAVPAWKYYTRNKDISYIRGEHNRDNPEQYLKEIDSAPGNLPLWLLFSHVYRNEEKFIVSHVRKEREKLKYIRERGASLYKFDKMYYNDSGFARE